MTVDLALTIDPGNTTGGALWFDGDVQETFELPKLQAMDRACEIVASRAGGIIAVENFFITVATVKTDFQPDAIYQIGVCEWLAYRYGWEFVLQKSSDAKDFMTNKRLRSLGWWVKGSAGHDNDALRHLGLLLVNRGWRDQRLVIA